MQIAAELNLPVFLHCRDAFDDFYRILCKFPSVRKCVHCHTEDDAEHLAMLLQLDCYIGITGWVCDDRRGKGLAALMKDIPLNRLMIETDGPFLLPRNMPRPYPPINESGYHLYE
jgi:TatD DNase family protein